MRRIVSMLGLMLIAAAAMAVVRPATAGANDNDALLRGRVERVLRGVPLIDGHNDVPWQYRSRVNNHVDQLDFAGDLSTLDPPMQTNIPRLREGMVGGQFWSVYIPIGMRGGKPGDARVVLEQIDFVHRLAAAHPEHLEIARTADDIVRIHRNGKIASLMGMEGGHSIENSLAVLRATYEFGARYMGLTHWRNTDWADAATDAPVHGGLTPFGKAVVREMNRLGMLVDLAHVSAETMRDAIEVSRAPVIFSHSSAFEVCRHPRNVPDDVLQLVCDNDGVVMICFLAGYVSEELRLWEEAFTAARQAIMNEHADDTEAVRSSIRAWREANPRPDATLEQVADHIDHIRRVAGIDHIGIGGDYDGTTSLPVGLEDVSTYPALFIELLRRGYSDEEIAKIAGLNVLRVMREVERVAAELQKIEPPSDALIEELDAPTTDSEDSARDGD